MAFFFLPPTKLSLRGRGAFSLLFSAVVFSERLEPPLSLPKHAFLSTQSPFFFFPLWTCRFRFELFAHFYSKNQFVFPSFLGVGLLPPSHLRPLFRFTIFSPRITHRRLLPSPPNITAVPPLCSPPIPSFERRPASPLPSPEELSPFLFFSFFKDGESF